MAMAWMFHLLLLLFLATLLTCDARPWTSKESPQYTVVHSESSFEIRLYRPSAWMTAPIHYQASFMHATFMGSHKLFQYIQGANMNFSRIPMSIPVLTGISPQSGPFDASSYKVRIYLPLAFQDAPPVPLVDLGLEVEYWDSLCVAVRKFPGIVVDENIAKQASLLESSLLNSPWANVTMGKSPVVDDTYTIAQYKSLIKAVSRVNEVWVSLSGPLISDKCEVLESQEQREVASLLHPDH